jgi:hypothetical protein
MGRVEQYHTHTRIVNGYKILPIPVPMGMKLYPYPYPMGTHTRWVPGGQIKYIQVIHYFRMTGITLEQLGPKILVTLIWRDEGIIARD